MTSRELGPVSGTGVIFCFVTTVCLPPLFVSHSAKLFICICAKTKHQITNKTRLIICGLVQVWRRKRSEWHLCPVNTVHTRVAVTGSGDNVAIDDPSLWVIHLGGQWAERRRAVLHTKLSFGVVNVLTNTRDSALHARTVHKDPCFLDRLQNRNSNQTLEIALEMAITE